MAFTRPPRARDLTKVNGYETVKEVNEEMSKYANNLQEVIAHSNNEEADTAVQERNENHDYDRKTLTGNQDALELGIKGNGQSEISNGDIILEIEREKENGNTENMILHKSSNEMKDGSNCSSENMNGDQVGSVSSDQQKNYDDVFQPSSTLSQDFKHVPTEDNAMSGEESEVPADEAETVFWKHQNAPRVPLVIITANSSKASGLDEFKTQKGMVDSGFYEALNNNAYNGSNESVGDNNIITGSDLPQKKVEFKIGGEDDTQSESSRRSSLDEKAVRFSEAKVFRRIRPITEYRIKDSTDSESNSSPDIYEQPRHERRSYDADRGFVKFSSQKKSPVDFRRSYSVDDEISTANTSYTKGQQDSLRPISFSEDSLRTTPTGSRRSSTVSNNGGMPGILKKSTSPSRLEVAGSDRNLERDAHSPPTNMSEGLRRYRRRSQLSISSDIPVDVPLKHRQLENEIRNKDNLEFIKRRISLQTDLPPQSEVPVEAMISTHRSFSSPGYVDDIDTNNNSFINKGRRYSDHRSPSPENRGYNTYCETAMRNGNVGPDNGRMPRNYSRESLGEKIVIQTQLSDEEINSYLGNIQPYERPYGVPPSPKDLQTSKALRSGIAVTETSGNLGPEKRLKQGFRSNDDVGEEDAFPEPYVPIRKQREKSERHTPNVNQMNMQRLPDITPPVRPVSESTSSEASLNGFNLSNLSLAGQRFASHIRKDSIALFNNKLTGAGPSKLRRFSQASLAEFEQLRRKHNELTKAELLKNYRLHIFVSFIFIIIVLSVSLSWYFKKEAQEKLYSSQAIFYNPRSRELTLSDTSKSAMIKGHLGLDIPRWMLPLHCPIVMGGNPHYKECLWKRIAVLRITHFQDSEIQCYNISWESLGPSHVPYDCFYISDAKWYGPSNQSVVSFPLQGQFDYNPVNVALINNGLFDTVVDFYWLSSHGTAIYVDANNPIQMSWNISGSDQLCLRSNFSGPLYHKTNTVQHPVMNYTLCQGTDPRRTHLHMQKMFAPGSLVQHPPDSVLTSAHWSVKSIAKTENINQSHVTDLLDNISHYGFEGNAITLDGSWQKYHGDLVFDEERFLNVTELMTTLNNSGSLLTLEVSPYFLYRSQNFHTGVESKMFVKDAGGEVTGLTNYHGGLAAVLDVFSERGREWYRTKLHNLVSEHQIKSYRLTYGQKSWLPYKPHFDNLDATPNMYRKHISDLFGKLPGVSLVMEHTSDSRHVASLIPVVTGLSEDKKCLTGLIETALTLGFMGYPYVMADGIKVEPGENDPQANYKPSRELYIRWLQLVSLFPAYQYSIAPWEYDQEIISIATNISVQRNSKVLKEMKSRELQLEVEHGYPILRPIWWVNGENHSVHDLGIKDEFLIGNYLLAAPILCEGTTERDVYVPSGVWENMDTKAIVLGPTIIRILNVTLDSVIMFQKRSVTGEMRSKLDF